MRAQPSEHGQDVVVEVEVLRALPGPGHLDREVAGCGGVAAHAADDALGEGEPELLVVAELRVTLECGDCGGAGLLVPRRVEVEPVALAQLPVSLGPEIGSRPREREVDVEEDRAQGHHPGLPGAGDACAVGATRPRAPGSEESPASAPPGFRGGRPSPGGTRRVGSRRAHAREAEARSPEKHAESKLTNEAPLAAAADMAAAAVRIKGASTQKSTGPVAGSGSN